MAPGTAQGHTRTGIIRKYQSFIFFYFTEQAKQGSITAPPVESEPSAEGWSKNEIKKTGKIPNFARTERQSVFD